MKGEIKALAAILILFGLVFTLGIGNINVTNAAEEQGSAEIEIKINEISMVDISPQTLDFGSGGVSPGSFIENFTSNGYELNEIMIENIGSKNLTGIWFNVTQPTSNPFGTGSNNSYNAGNFLAVDNGSTGLVFIDRIEYNHTTPIAYLQTPSNKISEGRLRYGNEEYFWAINASATATETQCNGSAGNLAKICIGTSAHNSTVTGDIVLTDNCYAITTATSSYGRVDGFVDIGGKNHYIAVNENCTDVRFYMWNAGAPGAGDQPTNGYYKQNEILTPGDAYPVTVGLYVPYGVAEGDLNNGVLTVVAEYTE